MKAKTYNPLAVLAAAFTVACAFIAFTATVYNIQYKYEHNVHLARLHANESARRLEAQVSCEDSNEQVTCTVWPKDGGRPFEMVCDKDGCAEAIH